MTKTGVTKSELESLKTVGFVEGDKNTIPENINPVLKSKLLAAMGEDDSGSTAGRQPNVLSGDDRTNNVDDATGRGKK